MKRRWQPYGTLLITAIFCSCIKPCNPPVTTVNIFELVVEGFINSRGDTAKIKLSHTVPIGSPNISVPETGATMYGYYHTGHEEPRHSGNHSTLYFKSWT